ncbi:MAG: dihydrolipoyllysine-residue acetyltransferase [Bermanella sp.]
MSVQTIHIPDIGASDEVEVIEISVAVGETVETDQTMLVLESDKTTMDIPAPMAGEIKELLLNVGDKVATGSPMFNLLLEAAAATPQDIEENPLNVVEGASEKPTEKMLEAMMSSKGTGQATDQTIDKRMQQLFIPDIGTSDSVAVIEVSVKVGDTIEQDQTLMVLESDKTTMDIPAAFSGVLKSLAISEGDDVTSGTLMGSMETQLVMSEAVEPNKPAEVEAPIEAPVATKTPSSPNIKEMPQQAVIEVAATSSDNIYAGPAVRLLAREMGINLQEVKGSAPRGRICKDDVKTYVKQKINQPVIREAQEQLPKIDFSQFGEIEQQDLSRIKQATARNMTRSWRHIPMVTQFDETDITELEHYRREILPNQIDTKVTMLAFVVKAVAHALVKFPQFNSSLDPEGKTLILKKYINIGIAVETPQGLMVPVIKDVNNKSLVEIAQAASTLAKQARDKKLPLDAMQGGCFSISSLGGIGGTQFTPIVNSPEVAILGLSKSSKKPVFDEGSQSFVPRLMLPLSLTYDHRVIDGAEAARFTLYISGLLQDIRHLLL